MKREYNPRNRNEQVDDTRRSWSTAFDDAVARRKERPEPCGFRIGDGGSGI